MNDFQAKYVITPIDKAKNNVAFICRRFKAQALVDKLGLQNSIASTTHYVFEFNTKIIKRNQTMLEKKFNLNLCSV